MNPSDQDWEQIHQLQFVDQPQCWTTCGGGFCCKTNSPHLQLNFMKPNSAGMVFFEGEYRFLEKRGLMQAGFQEASHSWRFPVADGLELRFITSVCALEGKCSIPQYRPLLCKLYPFLPRINLETLEVTGHVNASVIDQLWSSLDIEQPCTLVREKSDAVKRQMEAGIDVLKRFPYILFYLKAAELFLDNVSENFKTLRRRFSDLEKNRLVSKWEIQYLAGRGFDAPKFRAELLEQFQRLQRRFGRVELTT